MKKIYAKLEHVWSNKMPHATKSIKERKTNIMAECQNDGKMKSTSRGRFYAKGGSARRHEEVDRQHLERRTGQETPVDNLMPCKRRH